MKLSRRISVSIHAPTRGATPFIRHLSTRSLVSIHAPTRGATCFVSDGGTNLFVSIHAPTRGATHITFHKEDKHLVSIHAPTRGATSGAPEYAASWNPFQSTPPRGGRHAWLDRVFAELPVSIHAPTRGATTLSLTNCFNASCFNPRPHAGGDGIPMPTSRGSKRFQSTPPRGGRPPDVTIRPASAVVSIHAPTRGATKTTPWPRRECSRFNPRPHAGGDTIPYRYRNPQKQFQSTPPRGGRRIRAGGHPQVCCFNPRPHAGGDLARHYIRLCAQVSIHAPTRGATILVGKKWVKSGVSIHAPTRGATVYL